ncbi:hypothetical protein, variant [Exophiala mesophila]|uniref:Uncharacterized protein n=1 Tax=Exophiala mesophila TaxID=212818 RepID=A0A0D1XZJ9_EXOME|nr:uncharacterized protein PV10_04891 [Exophiala mesophila]XP_016225271.1 hypothetical protein, variant [Exophiala mesophila]KIV93696.1 hypothetical protein PV10_04891 [Exophiala mesophila]KIV93697.1 hypothetical protein, variant [Exophiala mesophila]
MAIPLPSTWHLLSLASLAWILGVFVTYWLLWIVYARCFHPLRNIPGPWLASVSRTWYMLQIAKGDMEKSQRRLHAKHGPLIRIAPNEVACSSPDAIKKIYRNQAGLAKTDFYSVWNSQNFSKHLDMFTIIDDKYHGERRRIFNHVYTLSNVLKSEQYIDICSQLFMDRLSEFASQGKPLDLGKWLQMYAFDVIGELYFGEAFGFLQNSHDHGSWIHSLDLLMPFLCMTAVAPSYIRPFILASSLVVPGSLKALKAIETIGTSARACVLQRFKTQGAYEKQPRADILEQLYSISVEKGDQVDFKLGDIQQEAYVALFAGSDTTAIALRSVFYHLMKHPAVYAKLLAEIDEATAQGQLSEPVKYAEAIKLPFLCACIKEALRLHPGVQLTMARLAPVEGLELSGTYIPAGYRVGMNAAVVHHDQSIFGLDADLYRPERWLEGNAAAMDKHLLHFGAGTRTCIGKNISLAELHKLVPYLLTKFRVDLWDENDTWSTRNLWFCKQEGLNVRVTPRTGATKQESG